MTEGIAAENARRRADEMRREADYCPATGAGCFGPRSPVAMPWGEVWHLPQSMLADARYRPTASRLALERLRCEHDFEFWAWRCVRVRQKLSGRREPIRLNPGQRLMVDAMERMRLAGKPVRLIVLKPRQCGASTLVTLYFAWIQIVLRPNWNSLVCAQVANTARIMRHAYGRLLAEYPPELWDDEAWGPRRLMSVSGAELTSGLGTTGSTVTVGSSNSPDSGRGIDVSLAHLSEVAYWRDSPAATPDDFVRAVCAGLPMVELSAVVLESTANGTGNFFHQEWLRSVEGRGDKQAVFIPWHILDINRAPVADPEAMWSSLDSYGRDLWERGLSLEAIAWYMAKRREYKVEQSMKAEFPTTPDEAFANSGCDVFSAVAVARLRAACREPAMTGELRGDTLTGPSALRGLRFTPDPTGALRVWHEPDPDAMPHRYVVAVDIGGRTPASDWSVIAVIDRGRPDCEPAPPPRVVAQWRGHCDHDLLAWRAAAIAQWYACALLVVESNTLETEQDGASTYILETVSRHYRHLYSRVMRDRAGHPAERRWGFHTNRATKVLLIQELVARVRDATYEEADADACTEMSAYRMLPDGSYGARPSSHDDILMTRAIGLYVATSLGAVVSCPVPPCPARW